MSSARFRAIPKHLPFAYTWNIRTNPNRRSGTWPYNLCGDKNLRAEPNNAAGFAYIVINWHRHCRPLWEGWTRRIMLSMLSVILIPFDS